MQRHVRHSYSRQHTPNWIPRQSVSASSMPLSEERLVQMENGVYIYIKIRGRAALAKRMQIEHKIATVTDDTCALCFRHCRSSARGFQSPPPGSTVERSHLHGGTQRR